MRGRIPGCRREGCVCGGGGGGGEGGACIQASMCMLYELIFNPHSTLSGGGGERERETDRQTVKEL